jgi:NAD(P)H dehydrogenase (quinone)
MNTVCGMYAVTGANGQLGQLVVNALLKMVDGGRVVGLVRDRSKASTLAAQGVNLRAFDYSKTETLMPALTGVERLLLISSSEVGQREAQHVAVIEAAKAAGVKFIAYTSILHADTNPLNLAVEHRATEAALKASGIPCAILRNGWYNENYTGGLEATAGHGVLFGSSGAGLVSSAARADYAEAAARILAEDATRAQVFELAGDAGFTQDQLAGLIAAASGKPVVYNDLPEEEYRKLLEGFGLPGPLAHILADSGAKAKNGALFDDSRTLSKLIGRPTTPIATSVKEAFAK